MLQRDQGADWHIKCLKVAGRRRPGALWRLRTPKAPINVNGAGDIIAALFLAHWLRTRSAPDAASLAASSVYGLIEATAKAGTRELEIVAAQEEFVRPSRLFVAEKV